MELTFLGTGSAMPTGERVQTGLLLTDEGHPPLLIDCGSGVLHRLAGTATGYEGIEHVLLTHHHLDHVSDLLPLMKAKWLAGSERLTVAGPPGTRELIDGLLSVHGYMDDRLDLTVEEVDEDEPFAFAGYDIEGSVTAHSMYCLAYRVAGQNGDLTFSADSEATPELAAFADGSAVLVHDCSFPDSVDVSNHPTPSALGETLAGHDYGSVYLTHLYPHTDGHHREMLDSVDEAYHGSVRFAEDGLTVPVAESS